MCEEYRGHPEHACKDCIHVGRGFILKEWLYCMYYPKSVCVKTHESMTVDPLGYCSQFKKREGPIVLVYNDL